MAASDPKVIYGGSGEADMRSDIGYGNGMYRSTDGGHTWTHIGLSDTQQIGAVLVDPRDAKTVYVAALGHAYGANAERGVFKSSDGGQTWNAADVRVMGSLSADEDGDTFPDTSDKEFLAVGPDFQNTAQDRFALAWHGVDTPRGGEAALLLENEAEPFQGGLMVKARPPNKKVLRLEALSGGEKSLVSLAFIFAIQEYDPSPFYLFDEVDQNLDAVNAEKVARMIRNNSATAQFLQISLRKVTLKEADHIVGVTMTPGSTSEVIMRVNLAEIEDEKPTAEVPA